MDEDEGEDVEVDVEELVFDLEDFFGPFVVQGGKGAVPEEGLLVVHEDEVALLAEEAGDVDLAAGVDAAVALDELRVDCSAVEGAVGGHEHAAVGPWVAHYFVHDGIFHVRFVGSILDLKPYTQKAHQDEKSPIHNDRPSADIALGVHPARVLDARCFGAESA